MLVLLEKLGNISKIKKCCYCPRTDKSQTTRNTQFQMNKPTDTFSFDNHSIQDGIWVLCLTSLEVYIFVFHVTNKKGKIRRNNCEEGDQIVGGEKTFMRLNKIVNSIVN